MIKPKFVSIEDSDFWIPDDSTVYRFCELIGQKARKDKRATTIWETFGDFPDATRVRPYRKAGAFLREKIIYSNGNAIITQQEIEKNVGTKINSKEFMNILLDELFLIEPKGSLGKEFYITKWFARGIKHKYLTRDKIEGLTILHTISKRQTKSGFSSARFLSALLMNLIRSDFCSIPPITEKVYKGNSSDWENKEVHWIKWKNIISLIEKCGIANIGRGRHLLENLLRTNSVFTGEYISKYNDRILVLNNTDKEEFIKPLTNQIFNENAKYFGEGFVQLKRQLFGDW